MKRAVVLLRSVMVVVLLTISTVTTAYADGYFGLSSGNAVESNVAANTLIGARFQNTIGAPPTVATGANMTYAAADAAGASYNGKLYVFGGYGTSVSNILNYTQIYDPTTDSWSLGANMPSARWGAAAAQYGGNIYVFGGNGGPGTKVEAYNVAGNSWTTKTSMPVTMYDGVMAATVGAKIYLFYFANVYEFDPSGNGGAGSYTVKSSPPVGKHWATSAYVTVGGQDRIYIIAGSTSSGVYTNSNYYYVPATDTWSSAQSPAPYYAHGTTRDNPAYNNKIYFGDGFGGAFYGFIYSYDPATDRWGSPVSSVNHARDGLASGFIGNTLYLAGGRDVGSNPYGLALTEKFQVDQASSASVITEVDLLFATNTPSGNVRLGVYADYAYGNGTPGNLLADAGAVTVANGWVSISGLTLPVTAGSYYWLAFDLDNANNVMYSSNSLSYLRTVRRTAVTYGALPDQFGTFTSSNSYLMVMRAYAVTGGSGNTAPVAANDAYTVAKESVLNVSAPGVLANDIDANGDPLTAVLFNGATNGSLTLNSNGSFSYSPRTGYTGGDSFTYKANDGKADSNIATVSITVTDANTPPVAANDAYTTVKDTTLSVAAPGVLANDSDVNGDPLTAVLVSGVSSGNLTMNSNGSFSYTPGVGFTGSDNFTYKANDGKADSNVATVSISVAGTQVTFGLNGGNSTYNENFSVLDAMRFQNTVGNGTLTKLEILFDDTTPNGKVRLGVYADNSSRPDSLLLDAGEVGVANGWVSIGRLSLPVTQNTYYWLSFNMQSANGVRYQTGAAQHYYWIGSLYGPLPASYSVSSNVNGNQYVMRATVNGPNTPPAAVNDAYAVDQDTMLTVAAPGVLANDSDPDGDPLTAALVSNVTKGSLTLNGNGSFSYTPNAGYTGSDSFTYKANDGKADSNTATVSITVRAVNHPPAAVNDAYSIVSGSILNVAAPGVLANDTDADGNPLTAVLVSNVSKGGLTLNSNGSFSYTSNAGYTGNDSFTYKANDGKADSNIATVSITITAAQGTFGLDAGNQTHNQSANTLNAMRFQNTAGAGQLTKLEILFADTTPHGKVRLGVYADNSGTPGNLLVDAGEVTVANGWVSISALNLPVTQNAYYWLAYNMQSSNGVRYQSGQPAGSHAFRGATYGTLPAQWGSISGYGRGTNTSQDVMRATVKLGS